MAAGRNTLGSKAFFASAFSGFFFLVLALPESWAASPDKYDTMGKYSLSFSFSFVKLASRISSSSWRTQSQIIFIWSEQTKHTWCGYLAPIATGRNPWRVFT